jgi:hypothetical protein
MTTSQPSHHNPAQLTLFAVDSPAKTSAKLASRPVSSTALGLVSFTNSSESFAWFDPSSSSWKTSQRSLLTDWTPFSENWPRQGLMRNGLAYRQVLWAPVTNATAGGLLPTPRANSAMTVDLRTQQNRPELHPNLETVMARLLPTPSATDHKGRSGSGHIQRHGHKRVSDALIPTGGGIHLNPSFVEEMMGFPVGWTA